MWVVLAVEKQKSSGSHFISHGQDLTSSSSSSSSSSFSFSLRSFNRFLLLFCSFFYFPFLSFSPFLFFSLSFRFSLHFSSHSSFFSSFFPFHDFDSHTLCLLSFFFSLSSCFFSSSSQVARMRQEDVKASLMDTSFGLVVLTNPRPAFFHFPLVSSVSPCNLSLPSSFLSSFFPPSLLFVCMFLLIFLSLLPLLALALFPLPSSLSFSLLFVPLPSSLVSNYAVIIAIIMRRGGRGFIRRCWRRCRSISRRSW